MNIDEIKDEINEMSKEDIGEIAEFATELYDSMEE